MLNCLRIVKEFESLFRIVIKFNVNHTVADDEENFELDNQQQAQQEQPKLLSKPNFEVDIVKNDTTLSLSCTFLPGQATEGEYGNFSLFLFLSRSMSIYLLKNVSHMCV